MIGHGDLKAPVVPPNALVISSTWDRRKFPLISSSQVISLTGVDFKGQGRNVPPHFRRQVDISLEQDNFSLLEIQGSVAFGIVVVKII